MILYDTQDPDVSGLEVCTGLGPESIHVHVRNNGAWRTLDIRVEMTLEGWRISDVRYPEGPSLVELLSQEY